MIHRFYVNNYRTLENFELPVGGLSSALLIGKNGAGKSNIGFALEMLQKIGRGENRVEELLWPRDMTHGRTQIPVRIELDVSIRERKYSYRLTLDLPPQFKALRVFEESLSVDGRAVFTRKITDLSLGEEGTPSASRLNWHYVWLPMAQDRGESDPIQVFRQWLSRMLILRPYPLHISGASRGETLFPNTELTNLGDWWTGLINQFPKAYGIIEQTLEQVMPDLAEIRNPPVARDERCLEVRFADTDAGKLLPFELLSDGEKCMVIWALVIAANKVYGPILCFWDEPDNFLALSEVSDFATDLKKAFGKGGQFIATSHSAETIRQFTDETTFVLHRKNHSEPTTIRALNTVNYQGDLIRALTRGDLDL